MNRQEIFDKVTTHLLQQNERAVSYIGSCSYRGIGNTMCAVGCLITDDEYMQEMEGSSVYGLYNSELLPAHLCPHITLLEQMQNIHDNIPVAEWPRALFGYAVNNCLTYNGEV